jgi:phasin family protein
MMSTTSKSTANKSTTKAVEDTMASTQETVETAVKAGNEAMTKNVEQGLTMGKEQFDKASNQMFKTWSDMTAYAKGNVDAMFQASGAMAKNMEEMGKTLFGLTQASMENGLKLTKQMTSAKSLNEVMDLQNNYARQTFDGFVAEGTKLSEMSMKAANETISPINERVTATVETFAKAS